MQMCQWVLLLEPFITGVRQLLDLIIHITRATEHQVMQRCREGDLVYPL